MRIIVNDIAASSGGAMTVLRDFYNYIREHDTKNEWIFLLGGPYIEETKHIHVILLPEVKQSHWKKLKFDIFTGKKFVTELQPDVVFSLQNIITFGLKIKQLVYIHQSIPFQTTKWFSFFHGEERSLAIYQYLIGKFINISAKYADRVIVQTQWMKNSVCKHAKIPSEKVSAILPTVGNLSAYRKPHSFIPTQFFYPTSNAIYKNNQLIYDACELLNQKGYSDFNVKLTLPNKEERKNITYTGTLPREQILEEYNHSTLIFPSYIETFGYPLAEAQQMGTLVFASNCPFSHEVLAGYKNAYFFNPFQPQSLADLMEQVLLGFIVLHPTMELPSQESGWGKIITLLEA